MIVLDNGTLYEDIKLLIRNIQTVNKRITITEKFIFDKNNNVIENIEELQSGIYRAVKRTKNIIDLIRIEIIFKNEKGYPKIFDKNTIRIQKDDNRK